MITVALRGLAGRKLRSLLTALAIVIGVAMVSATFVFTDTVNKGFTTIFDNSYKNASAVITGKSAFSGAGGPPPAFADSILPRVRRLPGVASAAGSIQDEARLIGRDGKAFATGGAPSVLPARRASRLNVLQALQYE